MQGQLRFWRAFLLFFALLAEAAPVGVEVAGLHRDYGVLAVQGPRSEDVLAAVGLPAELNYMSYADAEWDGAPVRICRPGYTGEHGYELLPAWDVTAEL